MQENTKKIEVVTPNSIQLINDIWVLDRLDGMDYKSSLEGVGRRPQIEINTEKRSFFGNDGCNNISGVLSFFDSKKIKLNITLNTQMACENMSVTRKFKNMLASTEQYLIKGMKLIFMDGSGKELMVFQKVD